MTPYDQPSQQSVEIFFSLATTNYDELLLSSQQQLRPVTWLDTDKLIGVVRNWDTSKIIFLHGYWRQPETVILDWKSYDKISRDEQYRENLAAFWKTSIWIYIGCGMNGLTDPDFGLLLERYGERARQAGHWDYCLVREDQVSDFQAFFDTNKFNICAISFGKEHADLPHYLHSLLPAPTPTGAIASPSSTTTDKINSILKDFLQGQAKWANLEEAIEAAIRTGFEQSYELQEKLIATLYKNGYDVSVNHGNVFIGENNESENAISVQQRKTLETEISRLRQVVDEQKIKEENISIIEARYRQHIIRWFERLTFQGMMRTAQAISLPLEEVYVELRAVGEVPEAADTFSVEERRLLLEIDEKDEKAKQELMHHMDTLRRERWSRTTIERKSIIEALFTQDQRAFVILGDPGSGKSTLLHLLALVYARGAEAVQNLFKAPLQELERLPIFVPLAAFDDMLRTQPGMTLLEFLPKYFERRRTITGTEPLFKRAMEKGTALILFDGLDEVIDSTTRSYVANQVTALIHEYTARGVRFVMTSRFVGYREAPIGGDIPHLSVLDFGIQEIKTFIHQWSHTYEAFASGGKETPETIRLAHQLEKDLLEDVESIASVRRLAANPLMLTMLALLRRQVGRLPHRRIDLYKRYMDTIIENWVEARSHGEREHSIRMLDPHQAESILIPLAYWLQSTQPSGTASKSAIHSALTDIYLQENGVEPSTAQRAQKKLAEDKAQEFLIDMRNMSGLIVERGYDAFGFLHLTFQEYFAGRALAQMEPEIRWEAIAPHLHDSRWREPILLCAGQLGTVEKRKPQVSKLVESILTCDDPTENDLHRNLLLALSIACDDVNLEHALLNNIIEKAMLCLPTNVYVVVRDIINKLGQLISNGVTNAEVCLSMLIVSRDTRFQSATIEALEESIEDPRIRHAILLCLDNQDSDVRIYAIRALAPLVSSDAEVRQAILLRLDDQDTNVQSSAVSALAPLVSSDAEVRQAIMNQLHEVNWAIRSDIINILAQTLKIPEIVHHVIPLLVDAERYLVAPESAKFVSRSLPLLANLIHSDAEVRQTILLRLDDHEPDVRNSAIRTLAPLVSSDAEVRQVILLRLDNQNWSVRSSAIRALAPLVSSDAEIRQVILLHLDDQDSSVRSSAVSVLAPLVSSDAEVRQVILLHLDDQDLDVRSSAVKTLASLVSSDADVRHAILLRLDDQDWKVRRAAFVALGKIEKLEIFERNIRTQLVSWLGIWFDDRHFFSDEEVYQLADLRFSSLFGSTLPADPSFQETIFSWLKSPRWQKRLGAVKTLVQWPGGITKEVITQILEALEDNRGLESYPARLTAAGYLINRDPYSKEAIQLALEALEYGNLPWEYIENSNEVRKQAALLLGTLEPIRYDQIVYDKLLQAMKTDQDGSVRDTLYSVLVKLAGAKSYAS